MAESPAGPVFLNAARQIMESYPSAVFLSTPIAETQPLRQITAPSGSDHWPAVATGLALTGHSVIAAFPRDRGFARVWEQVRQLAMSSLNVTIVAVPPVPGTIYDSDSSDIAAARVISGIEIFAPIFQREFEQILSYCVTRHSVQYVRLPENFSAVSDARFSPGRWTQLREGTRATLIATADASPLAMSAAEELAQEGIQVSVWHAGSIRPLDPAAISSAARKTKMLFTYEPWSRAGGLGTAVAEIIADLKISTPLVRLDTGDCSIVQSIRTAIG